MTATTALPATPPAALPRPGRGRAWLGLFVALPVAAFGWALAAATWLPEAALPAATAAGGAVLLVVAVCTYTDLRWRKIYNWTSYTAFLWGVLFSAAGAWLLPAEWQGRLGTPDLAGSLLGALIGFVGMLVAYNLSGGGAGDVKLATALGAWLGVPGTVHLLVYTYAIGGVVLLAWNLWQHGPVLVLGGLVRRVGSTLLPRWVAPPTQLQTITLSRGVPMSPFFAAGALLVLLGMVPS